MKQSDFLAIANAVLNTRAALAPDSLKCQQAMRAARTTAEQVAIVNEYERIKAEQARVINSLARSLADVCAKHNAKFNRARFLKACGNE